MKRDPVLMWLIGAMFVVILGLAGAINTYYSGRQERMEKSQERMENKIDVIQKEYGRIAVLEVLARDSQENQKQLKQQLDEVYRELIRR